MTISFDIAAALENTINEIARSLPAFDESFSADVRPADPKFGDYQANGVLPYAKRARTNPRQLGTELAEALTASGQFDPNLVSIEIAGPGFINFTCQAEYALRWLQDFNNESALKEAAANFYGGKKIVIDYASPNTAKQMHVGHLRSMVIGEAIQRLLRFCGADVIRDNHIGDWGTQFGILIHAIKTEGYDLNQPGADPLAELEALYKKGNALAKADDAAMTAARNELVKLQQGDPDNTALWQKITEVSQVAFDEIYQRLGIEFDKTLGESFYRDKVERIYTELTETNLAEPSQGALCVFHREHERFKEQPFIIRKQDGASNYATTDLATALYRVEEFQANEIIYVTDGRQQDHFQQLFLTVQKWFDAKGYTRPEMTHVWFGTILGEDGKAIKTRSGEPIKLKQLLDESVQRAAAIVAEKNPDLSDAERAAIAEAVGIGAVRYADLSQNRTNDYVFSWDKLLSFDGNTAPYLQYAGARIHSIYRNAGLTPGEGEADATVFETEQERALARKLMAFPGVLSQVLGDLRPHHLCTYLYELAGEFSSFYSANRVISDDAPVQARRLILCSRTLRQLETGLRLLGITPLEKM